MQAIDHASVNTLRFLAADQVEKAKSGHPGFPLGTAPLMYTLWDRFMHYNPKDPFCFVARTWQRFVVCNAASGRLRCFDGGIEKLPSMGQQNSGAS